MFDPIEYINMPRWQTVSLGLDRTRELLQRLGDPQDRLRFVHVAGTNGKGATSAVVASILEQAGYRCGLFTSPALYRFEDRIRVNGTLIASEELLEVTETVKEAADAMDEHPTEFELLPAVAFSHFARERCDVVVVEVGLGGRLDSTNVITSPEVSVITPISFDHCALLGDTLAQIAREKAGIIKEGTPIVCAPQEAEAYRVIEETACRKHAPLVRVDLACLHGDEESFCYRSRSDLSIGLKGSFQLTNAATALDAIDRMKLADWDIPEEAIRRGLECVVWPGRCEGVSEEPLIIFDGGHNVAGMEALIRALDKAYPDRYRLALTGVLKDKDYEGMAEVLALSMDEVFAVEPSSPRALSAEAYARAIVNSDDSQHLRSLIVAPDIASGVRSVLRRVADLDAKGEHPLVCICGSLYLQKSVMEVLRQVGVAL